MSCPSAVPLTNGGGGGLPPFPNTVEKKKVRKIIMLLMIFMIKTPFLFNNILTKNQKGVVMEMSGDCKKILGVKN